MILIARTSLVRSALCWIGSSSCVAVSIGRMADHGLHGDERMPMLWECPRCGLAREFTGLATGVRPVCRHHAFEMPAVEMVPVLDGHARLDRPGIAA